MTIVSLISSLLVGGAMLAGTSFLRGGEIAYASYYDFNPDIFLIDVDHGLTRNLTHNAAYDVSPAWSPDGRWIAFASDRSGRRSIYVMDALGGSVRRLTTDDGSYTQPRWSSDGKRLIFNAFRTLPGVFYSINFDGTDLQPLNVQRNPTGGIQLDIAYDPGSVNRARAPDGSRIAFLTYREQGWGIYLSADQSLRDAHLLASVGYFTEAPVWSPDSKRIAYIALREGSSDLYVIDADGSGAPRRLTTNHSVDTSPAWKP